jgi:tRNA-intron endonuclease
MISVMREEELIGATEIVRAGRLATTVKKRFIMAVPNVKSKNINYIIFKWWRA